VLGLIRESLFAALFGGGALADAYQVAFRIPNLLRDLFGEGALSSAFVPTFTASLLKDDKDQAYRLGNLALSAVLIVTGTLSILGVVFAEPVVRAISHSFAGDEDKVALATSLTRIMMPLLGVVSLSAVWMGMLNAQRRFLAPAYAPAMFNVTSILVGVALLFAVFDKTDALTYWSIGTLVGGLVQALFQLPALWKLGYRPMLRVKGIVSHPGMRRIGRLMLPAVIGLAAVHINIFINTRFASSLGDGPVAQLSYAFRVFYLPVGLFSVALATVTTTRVSEDVAREDHDALKASTAEGLSAVWMLMTASTVGLLVLATPVIELLFERGAFTDEDSKATALVLQAYVLGLLPYGVVKILAPVFFGLDRPRIPLFGSLTAVAINLGFNAATYQVLGAPGIALGMGLGAVANVLVLRVSIHRMLGPLSSEPRLRRIGALLIGNAVMGGLVFGLWTLVAAQLGRLDGVVGQLALAGVLLPIIAVGFLAYTAVLRGLGYPGADLLWSLPGKIYGRVRGRKS
jgi:putative peptidoglycan lipid II flippase